MKQRITALILLLIAFTGCSSKAQSISIVYSENGATASPSSSDSIAIKVDGASVEIDSKKQSGDLEIVMEGKSENGRLILSSQGRATIRLRGLSLTCAYGAPIWLKNKKRVEIVAEKDSRNLLCVASCPDTAASKQAAIWAKGKLKFSGQGRLDVIAKADGCKGINAKGDVKISDLTLSVVTEGNNLGKDTSRAFGFGGFPFGQMPEGMPDFAGGMPPQLGQMPEGFPPFPGFPGAGGQMPEGFPPFPGFPGGGGQMPEGFPPFPGFPGGGGMGFGSQDSGDPDETMKSEFKQKYIATTKAIKSGGVITISGGSVYCKTSSAGAEGIEGKKGVVISGGSVRVDAVDDAINSNGPIVVSGGSVTAESHCNDAIDSNDGGLFSMMMPFGQPGQQGGDSQETKKEQEPAFQISGGQIFAFSHLGSPEEGMDCDFAPFAISGGTIFTIGAGMGEMPSVPSQETAVQPTVLFAGLSIRKDEVLEIREGNKVIFSMIAPFSFNGSSSLFTCPGLRKGAQYTLICSDGERSFSVSDNFMVVRKN